MAYVNTNENMVGKKVKLTKVKMSIMGYFEVGSIVTITDVDDVRGYTFTDSDGNSVCEAGWDGFVKL